MTFLYIAGMIASAIGGGGVTWKFVANPLAQIVNGYIDGQQAFSNKSTPNTPQQLARDIERSIPDKVLPKYQKMVLKRSKKHLKPTDNSPEEWGLGL